MKDILNKYQWTTLILLSLFSGLLWRLEIEYYGWNTLNWYYTPIHISSIISLILFLVWHQFILTTSKKTHIYLTGITYATTLYIILPDLIKSHITWSPLFPLFIICNIPAGAFLILKVFGQQTSLKKLIVSYSMMIISFPATHLILMLTQQKTHIGASDLFKSGYLIVFWIVALGVLSLNKVNSSESGQTKKQKT